MTLQEKILLIFGSVVGASILISTIGCVGVDGPTGLTCEELVENPGTDIYFIVDSSDFNDEIWESAQQDPDTVRWNVAETQFIVKYNAQDVPRDETGFLKALNNPMLVEDIRGVINTSDWVAPETVANKETEKKYVDPNILEN